MHPERHPLGRRRTLGNPSRWPPALDGAHPRRVAAAAVGGEPWNDGHAGHAPVGSLASNPFGLFDLHGNVLEWTLDAYGNYANPRREGDGLLLGPTSDTEDSFWSTDYRVGRGGSFETPSAYARASHRVNLSPSFVNHGLGVRAARDVRASGR